MKKIILASFILTSFSLFALEEGLDLQVKSLLSLTGSEMELISQQGDGNVVIEFPTGTVLPLKFFLKGGLVSFVGEEKEIGQIKVERTFYVRFIKAEEFLFSLDLVEWKPLWDFVTGRADIALSIDDKNPSIVFGAEANQRK